MSIDNKKIIRRNCLHLYNPKEEGLGSYDVNYVNAYRKELVLRTEKQADERGMA